MLSKKRKKLHQKRHLTEPLLHPFLCPISPRGQGTIFVLVKLRESHTVSHIYLLFSSGCSAYMTERAYSLCFVCIPGLLSVSSASLLRWSHLPKLLAHNWHIEFQHIFCIATFVNIFHNKRACLISGPCTHTHKSLIFKFWMGICAFPLLFFCFSVATASYPEAISGSESFCWSGLQPIILQSGAPSEFWCKEASYLTIWLWKHCGNTTRQFAALECGPPDLLSSALARRLQIPGGTSFWQHLYIKH